MPTPTLAPLPQATVDPAADSAELTTPDDEPPTTGLVAKPEVGAPDSAEATLVPPAPTATPMPVQQISDAPPPTATPAPPTATPRASATVRDPIVQPDLPVTVLVIDLQTSAPLAGARVRLSGEATGHLGTQLTNESGLAQFSGTLPGDTVFAVEAESAFHATREQDVTIAPNRATITVALWPFVTATITEDRVNMRDLPHLDSKVIGSLDKGDKLIVRGISPDNVWLLLETTRGDEAWVSGTYAQVAGDLTTVPVLDVAWPFGENGQDDA